MLAAGFQPDLTETTEHERQSGTRRGKGLPGSRICVEVAAVADALEKGEKFEIQIAGERVYVPVRAQFNIEHEREGNEEEIEFQIKWTNE